MATRRSTAATSSSSETSTEYQVWYDAVDGARRSANAEDEAGVQQVIADLIGDENRRQLLAQSVGLSVPAHDHSFQILEVTTTTTVIEVPALPTPEIPAGAGPQAPGGGA